MIRIDGEFASLQLRSETCHCMRGIPISELLDKDQVKYSIKKSKGTLVVTFSPAYTQNMCITNFHYHYLNDDKNNLLGLHHGYPHDLLNQIGAP